MRSSAHVIEASLATLRRHLGMDVAFVSRFAEGRRHFEFVDTEADDSPVQRGASDPLEETYCARVADGRLPELVRDARTEPAVADLPATFALPVGAHMSVPLHRADGDLMGTLCCFSHEADESLRERDLQLLRMFADIVSTHLESLLDGDAARLEKRGLITAVLDGGPTMAMQPIVHTDTWHVRGFEALARFPSDVGWNPEQWFAEARDVGLGVELEASAIRAALRLMPRLPDESLLSVNVSAEALVQPSVLEMLTGEHADRLIVELTEHTRIDDYGTLAGELAAIRRAGASLAVDDAGSGWAGLEHILQLQPEVLKLDRTLVRDIGTHPGRQAMVEAMLGFSGRVGALLIAEGVETDEELGMLGSLGVEYAQGYLLGRPTLAYAQPQTSDVLPEVELR